MNRRGFLAAAGAAALAPRPVFASDVANVVVAVGGAQFIAIGERHDNPDHHRLQAALVAALAPAGIAFEMIPRAQEVAVNELRVAGAPDAEIEAVLTEAAPGWDWSLYLPIMAAAPDAAIIGGGLARSEIGAIYASGAAGVGEALANRYMLGEALPEAQRTAMLEEQFAAHCEMIEREKLGAMVEVQRAWDAAYADAWWRAGQEGGGRAILICGNAHARLDRGAPAYLSRAFPTAKIASIGLLEEGEDAPREQFTATLSAPAPERDDPCDQMREAMKKKE